MASVDLVMPKMGESIMEATILKWHKKPGDTVKMDETVLEIATDKVDSEVPSTAEGVIIEILFKENDVVAVGTVIAKISTDGANVASTPTPASTPAITPSAPVAAPIVASAPVAATAQGTVTANRFYSPLVLNIAAKEGIGMAELEKIPGTGAEGRVSKKDILNYIANKGTSVATPVVDSVASIPAPANSTPATAVATPITGNVEIVEMDRMRKMIADHMVRSKHTSPHVTSFTEADVTNIVNWRNKNKTTFEKQYGDKITFTPIFIEAVAKCIRKYPMINTSVDGDRKGCKYWHGYSFAFW
jgi:2-oxoglutarate dehydrogenase E2 component (dihydrolipoamide succinyltransferase)